MKLLKLIANLGYGSRKQVTAMFRDGLIADVDGRILSIDDSVEPARVRVDGAPLDPPTGFTLMLHKPTGYTCSTQDTGALVYELLPPRFRRRSPTLATVGRLDRDTTGLLLMTDDGKLLHRVVSPRRHLPKIYEATLARDLRGNEAAIFASGTLLLESERAPLAPATLEVLGPRLARVTVTEGRYHQVRRMFAAVGNHVEQLHRSRVGGLTLDALEIGKWRALDAADLAKLFAGP
ncbi:MAG TPA: pseudouridine synthase [Steroidobacteraceae bacterium]|nr:pseudouridine synthase [Steroidobacteraceae bacterium]